MTGLADLPEHGPRDLAALSLVPVTLAAIHLVTTESTRVALSLSLTDPTLRAVWTSTVVHSSWAHLGGNLLGYGLAVPATYAVLRRWGRTRLALVIPGLLLVTTPPVQSLVDYLVLHVHLGVTDGRTQVRGFSGVVGACAGMLMATTAGFVAHRTSVGVALDVATLLFLTASAVVLVTYPPPGRSLLGVAVLLPVGVALATRDLVDRLDRRNADEVGARVDVSSADAALVGVCVTVALALVALSFPANPAAGGGTTNIVAHLTGIAYGALVTAGVLWLVTRGDSSRPAGCASTRDGTR